MMEAPIKEGGKLFTSFIYKSLSKKLDSNFVTSPFALEVLLTLVKSGMEENCSEEFGSLLQHETIESVVKTLQDQEYSLKIVNKILVNKEYDIKEDFKRLAEDSFNTSVDSLDFSDVNGAAAKINQEIAKETSDKILDFLDPEKLTEAIGMILTSTLYFKGQWKMCFFKELTFSKDFYVSEEKTVKANFMQGLAMYNYYESKELNSKLLEEKLKGDVSLIIVLPNEKNGLSAVEDKIDTIFDSFDKFTETLVRMELLKFKFGTDLEYRSILEEYGIHKVFDKEEADFSRIAGTKGDLHLNGIFQKILIKVEEKAIETSGTYHVEPYLPCCAFIPPVQETVKITLDHPFMFVIRVKNVVLFVGRVVDPSEDNTQ